MALDATSPGSARAILESTLRGYGLGALTEWAYGRFLDGATEAQIYLEMRATPEYQTRFPAMADRRGIEPGFTEADYVEYEDSVRASAVNFGLPREMFDTPDDYAKLIKNNVSADEARQRMQISAAAAFAAPAEVRQAITDLYGVQPGEFVAYWLEPDRTLPILQQRYAASQIAGAGTQNRFAVERATAERLAAEGITYEQAQTGYDRAAALRALTAGEGTARLSQADLIGAQFGDPESARSLSRTQASRAAAFGGRSVQGADKGVSSLGSSQGT